MDTKLIIINRELITKVIELMKSYILLPTLSLILVAISHRQYIDIWVIIWIFVGLPIITIVISIIICTIFNILTIIINKVATIITNLFYRKK
jgi:hypothetical protein